MDEDEELMARAVRGEWAALERLLSRYEAPLLAFFHRLGCPPGSVADLVQTVMIRIYDERQRYDQSRPLAPWVYGIARNVWREHLRRVVRERLDPLGESVDAIPSPALNPARRLEQVEEAELVRRAVGRLPEDQRLTLVLRHWHGLTYEETSEALGVPLGTVKWRLHDALRKLGAWLGAPQPGGAKG